MLAIGAIASYERYTVDPWSFLGEDRGAMFFRWSPYLSYDKSTFGDFVLVLDGVRFWSVLLLPVLALVGVALVLVALRRHAANRKLRPVS